MMAVRAASRGFSSPAQAERTRASEPLAGDTVVAYSGRRKLLEPEVHFQTAGLNTGADVEVLLNILGPVTPARSSDRSTSLAVRGS